jgi:cytochrome c oxidase subunit 2
MAACGAGNSDEFPQTALDPQGEQARWIDDLWWLVFWIAVAIFVLVMGVYVVAIVRFRRRKGETDEDRKIRQTHGNTRLEVVWTIIPAVLLAVLAVPTVSTLFDIRTKPAGEVLEVTVIGHQWWWEYQYPSLGINTANELHIPADTNVYLSLGSADVIHSFWLPSLNGKRDAVPGRVNNLTLIADDPTPPGEPLLGQCAEFCGLAHADMRLRVFVHDDAGFDAWVASQQRDAEIPAEGAAAAGWDIYNRLCTACHVIANPELDPEAYPLQPNGSRVAPDLTHFAQRTTFAGATWDNTTEHL